MEQEFLDVLQDPRTGEPLVYSKEGDKEFLQNRNNDRYEIQNGIVRFLKGDVLTGNNQRYQKLYDRLAPIYDLSTKIYANLKEGNVEDRLIQYLKELNIRDGHKAVEISVGTGRNLIYLNPHARYFGVDISFGMLKRCQRVMKKNGRSVGLIQAEAERLPIRDNSFDVVFSAGGFNFFNNRAKAVNEMLRIARSGTKLLISDETEKVRAKFEKSFAAKKFYGDQEEIRNPVEFVPPFCRNIEYKEVCGGELYALTFWKP
jgi:ubiquinone/menaquinone biosynthesis C-methylase UbiE